MVPERIEILFLIDYFHRTGGTEKHLVQLITGLPPERFRCAVVVFDAGENTLLEELRRRGVPIIHLPVGREYVPNALRQAWRLAQLIRRHRYDIVQTYHLGEARGIYFIAMELIRGVNLEQFTQQIAEKKRTLPVELAVFIASRIARGISQTRRSRSGRCSDRCRRDARPPTAS